MTKAVTSQLIVQLLDQVSGPAAKAGASLKKLEGISRFTSSLTTPIARNFRELKSAAAEFRNSLMGPAGLAAGFAAFEAGQSTRSSAST